MRAVSLYLGISKSVLSVCVTLVATKRLNFTKIFQVQAFGCKILVEVVYGQNYLSHFKIAAILHTVKCKEIIVIYKLQFYTANYFLKLTTPKSWLIIKILEWPTKSDQTK